MRVEAVPDPNKPGPPIAARLQYNYDEEMNSIHDSVLTSSAHLSVRVIRGQIEYVKYFYPWVNLEERFESAGLALPFFYDESHWVSTVVSAKVDELFLELTGDPNFDYHTGHWGMTSKALGSWLFSYLKLTQTSLKLYQRGLSFLPVLNRLFTAAINEMKTGEMIVRFDFQNIGLSRQEFQVLTRFQQGTIDNARGYFEAVPTVLGLPLAQATLISQAEFGLNFSFELNVKYQEVGNLIQKIIHYNDEPQCFLVPFDATLLTKLEFSEYEISIKLSKREADCLIHLLRGRTAKETAEDLNISARTVETYWVNIKDKLGCESKAEVYDLIIAKLRNISSS